MKKILTISALCGVFVLAGASLASAQSGAAVDVQVTTQASATSSEAKGNVETEWKVEKGEKAAEEEGSGVRGSAVSASAVEVRGWDAEQKQEFLATVKAHAQVQSGQDLDNFATGVLLRDENVEAVTTTDKKVEVAYRMPAKFLGILDASLAARAEVDAEGRVKVRYPWFGFLFGKLVSVGELQTDIEAALPEVGDEVIVSFEAQARTITTLSNIMKAKHDAAITGSTTL